MRLLKLTFLLLIFSLIACNKENNYRIIEPGSYFPVYPDSWWKYIINDSIIIKDSTNENYILDGMPPEFSEQVYIPVYYSASYSPIAINGPIYKYHKIINYPKRGPGSQLWPILSETIGYSFDVLPYEVAHSPYIERATVQAKIFNGQDSILIINGHFEDVYGNDTLPLKRHREFTKNIGLSMNVLYDTIKMDTVYKSILIDHYINN
jgi:hypothetical protein